MLALHKPETVFSFRHAPSWLMLTFAAGAVNAGAFLASERFVTHVTGSVTRVGLDVGSWTLLLDYALVVGCFVLGAMASVLAIDGRYHRGKRPLYAAPLVAVSALVALVALLGRAGLFGTFGGAAEELPDFAMLSMLSFAMGLQNAAVATSTGLVVRTTHLTGPATDLGIHLATGFFARGAERAAARRGALLRAGKLVAFVVGAAAMVPAAGRWGYAAFFFPALLVLTATALSFVPSWSALEVPLRALDPETRAQRSQA